MTPILWDEYIGTTTKAQKIGWLRDATKCLVTEKLNDLYELQMTYETAGALAESLIPRAVIQAQANLDDDPQYFRIYKVTDNGSGTLTVYAKHISYDLSGFPVAVFTYENSGNAFHVSNALAVLATHQTAVADLFTIKTTDTESTATEYGPKDPGSYRECLAGREGSIIDTFGGEWQWDNFSCYHMPRRGADNGVQLRYKKDILNFNKELSSEKLYSHVKAYYRYGDGLIRYGDRVSTSADGTQMPFTRVLWLDCSDKWETTPSVAKLNNYAEKYVKRHKLDAYTQQIKFGVLTIEDVGELVSLGDTVTIIYKGDAFKTRVRQTVWDTLNDRYDKIVVGDNQTDSITQAIRKIK